MAAALKRMIEAGGGVAPSITRSARFWSALAEDVKGWADETLGVVSVATIKDRRMLAFGDTAELAQGACAFILEPTAVPGLRAIFLDQRFPLLNAARRLSQPAEKLSGASALFLRLLCEPAADALRERLVGEPGSGPDDPPGPAFLDQSGLHSGASSSQKGFHVSVQLSFESETLRVDLVYDAACAANWVRQADDTGSPVSAVRHDILTDCVRASHVSLSVMLDQIDLTIGRCARLAPGDVIALPRADPDRLRLTALTLQGEIEVGSGSLGINRANRALKLHAPLSESFVKNNFRF